MLSAPRLRRRPWLAAIAASAGGVQLHVALSGRSIVARSAQLGRDEAERIGAAAAQSAGDAGWMEPGPIDLDGGGVAVDGAYAAAETRP